MISFDEPFGLTGDFGFGDVVPIARVPDAPVEVAPGITGTFSDPFPPASFPSATMPSTVRAELFLTPPASAPVWLWRLEKLTIGRARMELGDDYALFFNEGTSEVLIENRAAQTETRIFGNAQVEVNGEELFQFWGTTSFELANGTKITANTVQVPDNSQAYMLDKLTITDETHAVIVTGVNDLVIGDLTAQIIADPFMTAPIAAAEVQPAQLPLNEVPLALVEQPCASAGIAVAETTMPSTSDTSTSQEIVPIAEMEPVEIVRAEPASVSTEPDLAPFVHMDTPSEASPKPLPPTSASPEATPSEMVSPPPTVPIAAELTTATPAYIGPEPIQAAIVTPLADQPQVTAKLIEAAPIVEAPTTIAPPIATPPPKPTAEQLTRAADAAWVVDDDVRDGFVLKEATNGKGWLVEDESHVATQIDLNETAIGAEFGPGSSAFSQGEFGIFYNRVFSQMLASSFANLVRTNTIENTAHDHYREDRDKASDKANIQRRLALGLDQAHQIMMVGLESFALKEARRT